MYKIKRGISHSWKIKYYKASTNTLGKSSSTKKRYAVNYNIEESEIVKNCFRRDVHLNKAAGLNMVVIETFSASDDFGINI